MKISHISLLAVSAVLLVSCGGANESTSVNQTGATSSGAKSAVFPMSVQSIIGIQLKDPDAVLKLNCDTYDEAGKKYCNDEKAKMTALKNEVTWESVLKK